MNNNNGHAAEYYEKGFLMSSLLLWDRSGSKRWDYWFPALITSEIPEGPIPQIDWMQYLNDKEANQAYKDLLKCSAYGNINNFLSFMLWGFGEDNKLWINESNQVLKHWEEYLFKAFPIIVVKPRPYITDFLQETISEFSRKHSGNFPTPIHLAEAMARMIFIDTPKTASVVDPCAGAGNLLLAASNYSLNLYGSDINLTMVQGLKIQGYLYIPWLVKITEQLRLLMNAHSRAAEIALTY